MTGIQTQAASLRNILRRATPHGLARGGLVTRANEGELLIVHLTDTLKVLEALKEVPAALAHRG